MFSRIGCCIEYNDICAEQKMKIVDKWYLSEQLNREEKNHIEQTNILAWFKENAENKRALEARKLNRLRICKRF